MIALNEQIRGFTPAQCEVVNLMSCLHTEADLVALKSVLVQFLNSRMQDELDRLYANGSLSDEKMSTLAQKHLRTPYRGDE